MRIIVKILLSIVVVILGVFIQGILFQSGAIKGRASFMALFPVVFIIFGLVGVWKYKPDSEDKNFPNRRFK